ncbi:hypothetical protein A4G19_03865 [Pasteurellaceae bacterium Macca]|nr:hypothetical protein [Pasteurellaceae bacterium Macca]
MQRLTRTPITENNRNTINALQHFYSIKKLLEPHLPPSTFSLFAQPQIKSDIVEWYSPLQGQPIKVDIVQDHPTLIARLDQRLNDIRHTAKQLQHQQKITESEYQQIQQLLQGANHDSREIYQVNGDPVIVAWGMGKEIVKPITPPVSAVAPATVASRKHLCCWLLPLLLLLLALFFILWWFWLKPQPAVVAPVAEPVIEKPVEEKKPELVETPKPVEIKEEVKPEEPKIEEPNIEEESKEDLPVSEPTIVAPKPEVQKAACVPKNIVTTERDKMVIVFDNSYSMLWSLSETNRSIQQFIDYSSRYGATNRDLAYMQRTPNRLGSAKKAASQVIDQIGNNMDIGLISLTVCPSAKNHGFFGVNQRGKLKKTIKGMWPREGGVSGTPLYSGLQKAASMLDGKKKESFILLISDGEDNCSNKNICQLARKIAKSQPKLKVNVVDIGSAGAANCVAHATGGKVFQANSAKQVTNMINQAIQPVTKQVCE